MAENQTVEKTEDFGKDGPAVVSRWLAEFKAYESKFDKWIERSKKIVKRYRDEQDSESLTKVSKFNILWANTQIMGPALYAKPPVPDVSRRYKDRDPVARSASVILERCLAYSIDIYDFDATIKAARDDYILTARGQAWVRYVPHFGDETQDRIPLQAVENGYRDGTGAVVDTAKVLFGESDNAPYMLGEPYRPVAYEEVVCDHIPWGDFGHSPAPKWEKVPAVWKRELLTREQLVERFGEIGSKVQLTGKADGIDAETLAKFGDVFKRGIVYEIWHKPTKKVIWISPGYTEGCLDEREDPLRLNGFFPCPRPIFGTMTTDTLVPIPDYAEYQSQAMELDTLTQRISLLIDAIRVVGVYNGELTELQSLLQGSENKMVAVDQWAMFAEKGGLKGAVDFFPVAEIATVLQVLAEARERIKQDLFEISGISDIVRGQVDPREKLGQSQMKGQFANLRLQDRQSEMNRFVRDLLRLKGEIIAEHFSDDTILEMSGWMETTEASIIDRQRANAEAQIQQSQQQTARAQQAGQGTPAPAPSPLPPTSQEVFQQAVQLLRQDRLRTFRVDIESDSTVFADQQAEKQSRSEFLTAVGGFMQQAMVAGETNPGIVPLMGRLLLFGVRGFKVGREVEGAFEEALEDLEQNPPQQQQGDPAAAKQAEADAAKAQAEGVKAQIEQFRVQMEQAQAQHQAQLEQQQFAHQQTMERLQFQADEADRKHQRGIEEQKVNIQRILAEAKLAETQGKQVLEGARLADDRQARREQQALDVQEADADRAHQADLAAHAAEERASSEP